MSAQFTAQVYQNQFLPQGADEVHAIMTVTSSGQAGAPSTAKLVFGIMIDCSGSMGDGDGARIRNAKAAVREIIRRLRPDAEFFIISGSDCANVVSPLSPASDDVKNAADRELSLLQASGGTRISTWLAAALNQFPRGAGFIRQALLLTDGKNAGDDEPALDAVLHECEGRFQCDARGVGVDWQTAQLRKISTKLLGTVDIIRRPEEIGADFQSILEKAQGRAVSDVTLRLWTPQGAAVKYCKQVSPEIVDLTDKACLNPQSPQVRDYATGAWGTETRDYHFCIQVKPGDVGQRMLAGRASLVLSSGAAETKAAESQILATWTDDEARSAVIDRRVAHYTGQGELAQAVQEGLQARRTGNEQEATRKLGRAVQLAAESGNDATTKLLRKVVDVIDKKEGTVKLRRSVDAADEMELDTRSTKTRRIKMEE